MHRALMPLAAEVDHRNGHGLDNRISNLRPATPSKNNSNVGKRCGNYTSNYKGVSGLPSGNWRAELRCKGRRHHLGVFESEEKAAMAYDMAASEYHGEFALTNKMLGLLP